MREWWLRTVLVLSAPRAVFVALRDDSNEEAAQRAEPVLLIVLLAGMAFVLSTHAAATLMDRPNGYDGLLVAVWAFLAGALYGGVAYLVLGGVLQVTGGRARHAGLVPARPPRARLRRCARRAVARPLAGQARALRRRRSSTPAARTAGSGGKVFAGCAARLSRLVGLPARDRRPRGPRLELGCAPP